MLADRSALSGGLSMKLRARSDKVTVSYENICSKPFGGPDLKVNAWYPRGCETKLREGLIMAVKITIEVVRGEHGVERSTVKVFDDHVSAGNWLIEGSYLMALDVIRVVWDVTEIHEHKWRAHEYGMGQFMFVCVKCGKDVFMAHDELTKALGL